MTFASGMNESVCRKLKADGWTGPPRYNGKPLIVSGRSPVIISPALLPVLRFDRTELGKTFHLFAVRSGEGWRLDFVPRAAELARTFGRITVIGAGDAVRRLEFRRSATQRVEIIIGATQTGVTFTPDEERRFFR